MTMTLQRLMLIFIFCLIIIIGAGFTAATEVILTLEAITTDELPNHANDVYVFENYAYVADSANGLVIVDISDPKNPITVGNHPSRIGEYGSVAMSRGVAVSGNYAYVANWYDDVYIIDISDRTNPMLVTTYKTGQITNDVTISGDYAFISRFDEGVDIVNISDPTNPGFISNFNYGWASNVAILKNYAYVADTFRVTIVDISDLANPLLVGSSEMERDAADIEVYGKFAYVADAENGLVILNVSNPTIPTIIGHYDTSAAWGIDLFENYVLISDGLDGVITINVSDPTNPILADSYDTPGFASSLKIDENLVYVADDRLVILNITTSSTSGFVHNINKSTSYTTIQAAIDDASPGDEIHVNSGTYYENVIVNKQLTLRGVDTGAGMPVVNAGGSGHVIILSTDGITLEGFTVTNSGYWPAAGIYVSIENNVIRGNIVSFNSVGIFLDNTIDNTIESNNVINNNDIGIRLLYSDINTVRNNEVSYNLDGISLESSGYNSILSNAVSYSLGGISLYSSYSNTITDNNVDNNYCGIYLGPSWENMINFNNLIENEINANDESAGGNQWDSNYYSDYLGIDENNDGIGDTPYPIPGGSSVDRYPLMAPYSPPPSDHEGELLRETGDFRVYLIEDGKKRHFTSPEALEWNGYSLADVIEVSEGVINSFELGSDISITQAIIDKYNALGGTATFGLPAGTGKQTGYPDNAGVICTYVNFQNGAIEYFTNGDMAGNAYAIFNPFFSKWASMGYANSVLGYPISDMSDVQTSKFGTEFKYQNFKNGDEKGSLEYNLATGEVYEIHGAIYAKWEEKGFANGALGLVTGDEKEAGKSPFGTTGRYSEFENGHIHWISDLGDDNAGKIYRGEAFATYGDLDWFYTNDDGTNGKLGFPVMDKYETTTYGHGECVFEGGKIIWDDYRGLHEIIYYGYLPDLTITDISFSKENPAEGEPITIYATVKNVGYTDAIGEIAVTFSQQSYYEDFETDETGRKAYIGKMVRENLGARESSIVSMTWNTAPVFSINPDGFIHVEVDSSNKVEETNEYNNVKWGKVTISSRSNFKPEIDSYHFKNFALSGSDWDKMTTNMDEVLAKNDYPAYVIELIKAVVEKYYGSGGNCFGMSSSSALYYQGMQKPADTDETFNLMINDEGVKQNIFDAQIMTVVNNFKDIPFHGVYYYTNLEKEYNFIKNNLNEDKLVLPALMTEGSYPTHSIIAYNTYDVSDTIKNVLVYDPNYPGMGRVMQFDLEKNEVIYYWSNNKNIRSYASTQSPLIYSEDLLQNEIDKLINEINSNLYTKGKKWISIYCPVNVRITDQYGRVIDDMGINEIPDSEVIIIGDMKIFLVPSELNYFVNVNAYDPGDFSFTQINPLTNEYASLISFVDIPISQNTKATFDISSANPDFIMEIDYDGDGSTDEIKAPDIIDIIGNTYYNITFLPPITTMDQFSLTDGSTLPIKFTARNSTTDEFIYDNTVNVTITNSTGHLITYFTNGTGRDSIRINSEEEQYIVNFHTKDYDLNVGETYTVTVTFGESDSLRGYEITYFTLIEGGKAKGKGRS